MEMGFSRELSIQALRLNRNSFEGAFAWLTGENTSDDMNDPQIAASKLFCCSILVAEV